MPERDAARVAFVRVGLDGRNHAGDPGFIDECRRAVCSVRVRPQADINDHDRAAFSASQEMSALHGAE
jgi:hypothetical protein